MLAWENSVCYFGDRRASDSTTSHTGVMLSGSLVPIVPVHPKTWILYQVCTQGHHIIATTGNPMSILSMSYRPVLLENAKDMDPARRLQYGILVPFTVSILLSSVFKVVNVALLRMSSMLTLSQVVSVGCTQRLQPVPRSARCCRSAAHRLQGPYPESRSTRRIDDFLETPQGIYYGSSGLIQPSLRPPLYDCLSAASAHMYDMNMPVIMSECQSQAAFAI